MSTTTVEDFIDTHIGPDARKPARLALEWLRRNPAVVDTVVEVYAEGANGNPDAFRAFAATVWDAVNNDYGGVLESWDVAPDDESRWVGTLALVVGAWGMRELGKR